MNISQKHIDLCKAANITDDQLKQGASQHVQVFRYSEQSNQTPDTQKLQSRECTKEIDNKSIKAYYTPSLASSTQIPYPLYESSHYVYNDSSIYTTDYIASYANADAELIKNATTIGNQKLIPVAISFDKLTEISNKDQSQIDKFHLEYIVTFLQQNDHIKYIVDVGCGDASISLILQKIIQKKGFDVTVFAVDVNRYPESIIPFNLLPAQNIKNVDPSETAFTAIHPFIDDMEFLDDEETYYIHQLIKNNPGCFVLTTQDTTLSNPNIYIPAEFVCTKKLYLPDDSKYIVSVEFKKINNFFEKLPENYKAEVQEISERQDEYLVEYLDEYDKKPCIKKYGGVNMMQYPCGLDSAFHIYTHMKLESEGVDYLGFLYEMMAEKNWNSPMSLFYPWKAPSWWHVYKN